MSRARDLFDRLKERGVEGIDALIADRAAEEQFLDFKRSANNGLDSPLNKDDNENLSKAMSGFGNSAGGIIVWGVKCVVGKDGADVASAVDRLHDAQSFLSRIESAISRLTIPPHDEVQSFAIVDPDDAPKGFVITLIPQSSRAPLRAEAGKLHNYYIRAGSSFQIIPHDALAGLFGRPPRASLALRFVAGHSQLYPRTSLPFALAIENTGSVLAEKVYLSASWDGCERVEIESNRGGKVYDCRQSIFPGIQAVAADGSSLAPDAIDDVLSFVIYLPSGRQGKVSIRVTFGARNAEPKVLWIVGTKEALEEAAELSKRKISFMASDTLVLSESPPS